MKKINNNILLGISLTAAIIFLAGFLVMTVAYFQKSKELADAYQGNKNTNSGQQANNDGNKTQPSGPVNITVGKDDWIRGNVKAPITIVEFSDFQCPYCAMFHKTLQQVIQNNTNVRWVYKFFPLPSHQYGRKAALAAECAGEQGKFWDYADQLFANQASFSDTYFSQLASDMKLNSNKFDSCLSSEKYASQVDSSQKLGQQSGVNATPTSFINGQKEEGALPYADLMAVINKLKK